GASLSLRARRTHDRSLAARKRRLGQDPAAGAPRHAAVAQPARATEPSRRPSFEPADAFFALVTPGGVELFGRRAHDREVTAARRGNEQRALTSFCLQVAEIPTVRRRSAVCPRGAVGGVDQFL